MFHKGDELHYTGVHYENEIWNWIWRIIYPTENEITHEAEIKLIKEMKFIMVYYNPLSL